MLRVFTGRFAIAAKIARREGFGGLGELEQLVQNNEFHLEFNTVHARLEKMLEDVKAGVLEADQRDVQRDNQQVDTDEVPNRLQGLPSMDVLHGPQHLEGVVDVNSRNNHLLDGKHGE